MIMPSQHPYSRQDAAARLRRDVTWGRLVFLPPELANPRVIFDPMPFRAHQFTTARPKKSSNGH
jgi:hypothetical protein